MTKSKSQCAGAQCVRRLPVAQMTKLGHLHYCDDCAPAEERARAVEAEDRRAAVVQLVGADLHPDGRTTRNGQCGPACYCCAKGVPADGYHEEGGITYAHLGRPA